MSSKRQNCANYHLHPCSALDRSFYANNSGVQTEMSLIENDYFLKPRPRSLNVKSVRPETITCQCMWKLANYKITGTINN